MRAGGGNIKLALLLPLPSIRYVTQAVEPGLLLLRLDAPLHFYNAQHFREGIRRAVRRERRAQGGWLHCVILNLSPVTAVDTTAVHMLEGLLEELRGDGLALALANPCQQVRACACTAHGGCWACLKSV